MSVVSDPAIYRNSRRLDSLVIFGAWRDQAQRLHIQKTLFEWLREAVASFPSMTANATVLTAFLLTFAAGVNAWTYDDHKDQMTGRVTRHAFVDSTNRVTFDFPYGGP